MTSPDPSPTSDPSADVEPLVLRVGELDTPIGRLLAVVDRADALRAVHFDPAGALAPLSAGRQADAGLGVARRASPRAGLPVQIEREDDPGGCVGALRAYFAGALEAIDGVRVDPVGTSFQREVWQALRGIPCGATWSYGELARHLGRPAASRAVGLANGANPIAVIIPCHRVIGANGTLTGYGGGLERKRWLLAHESRGRRLF